MDCRQKVTCQRTGSTNALTDAIYTLLLMHSARQKVAKLEEFQKKFYTEEIDYFFELPNIACGYIGSIEERADKEQLTFADKELETIIESLSNHEIVWNNPITSLAELQSIPGRTKTLILWQSTTAE